MKLNFSGFFPRVVFLFFILFCISENQAQSFEPLKSKGQVPDIFLKVSSQEFERKVEEAKNKKHRKRYERKAEEEFHLSVSYFMHEVLFSGRVLFGDPVTAYINKVVDELLKNDPTLRSEINIFAFKSSSVNALCFPNGVILINTGLISQLETENQLAMVIAHEITHYVKKHSLNRSIEKERMKRGKGEYGDYSDDKLIEAYYSYSRENEAEADEYGFELLKKSKYNAVGVENLFRILKYSYLPYDLIDFDYKYLTYNRLKLPEEAILKEVEEVESEDIENSTHPSADSRLDKMKELLSLYDHTGKSKNIVGKEAFKEIRFLARKDLSQTYLMQLDYPKAIYNSFLNINTYGDNIYDRKIIAKSLYALAKYDQENELNQILEKRQDVAGEWQKIYEVIWELEEEDLVALALSHNLELLTQQPEEEVIKDIVEDLVMAFVIDYDKDLNDFEAMEFMPDSTFKEIPDEEYNAMSKADKFKYKEKLNAQNEYDLATYAIAGHKGNDHLLKSFSSAMKEKKRIEDLENMSKKMARRYEREQRKKNKKGKALGIDRVVIFDPEYSKSYKNKAKNRLKQTEKEEFGFNDKVKEVAEASGLDVQVVDDYTIKRKTSDSYNNFCILKRYANERFSHLGNDVKMVNLNPEEIDPLVETYNTNYLITTGILTRKIKNTGKAWSWLASIYFYPAAPLFLYSAYKPHYQTLHYYIVFDMAKGKPVWVDSRFIEAGDYDALVKSILYNDFVQTKRTSKR